MRAILPVFAAIAVQTNCRCTLRCRFCFYGQYPDYQTGEIIETALLDRLFDELAHMGFVGRLSLYNLNEPLTDGRIVDLLARARGRLPRCSHFLSTNGVLLSQPLLRNLLELVDGLRINSYGGVPNLDYSDPKIDLRDRRGSRAPTSSNRGGNLHGLPGSERAEAGPCANPFGQMVVMPPGIAVLCCGDGFQSQPVGDLRRESIADVWYGRKLEALRRKLANGRRQEIALCRACNISGGGFREYFLNPARFEAIVRRYASGDHNAKAGSQ